MIDHNMNKTQLRKIAGLSTNVLAKLSKNDSVSMDSLMRICRVFQCDVGDIVEIIDDSYEHTITEYPNEVNHGHLLVAEKNDVVYRNK